jgi:pyruvate dehydrogenase E1 component alpha subunit
MHSWEEAKMDRKDEPQTIVRDKDEPTSESRRGFLQLAGLTGAVVSTAKPALAVGDIVFFAKDLSDDKLIEM